MEDKNKIKDLNEENIQKSKANASYEGKEVFGADKQTGSPNDQGEMNPQGPNILNVLLMAFLITFVINVVASMAMSSKPATIGYGQFLELVEKNSVSEVVLSDDQVQMTVSKEANLGEVKDIVYPEGFDEKTQKKPEPGSVYTAVRVDDPDLVNRLSDRGVLFSQTYSQTETSPFLGFILAWIIPALLMYFGYLFFVKRMKKMGGGENDSESGLGGFFGIGKSKAKKFQVETETNVTFKDVAGQDEAKESLMEMVDYLRNPEKYQEIGAKQPKGALLVGPPGTGKTLLAKAVAGESGVPFYSISGSEFVEMFVGVGASRVRDLFVQAKKQAPCIIFIDEIDAIGKSRDNQMGSNDEREQTLNQLLAEMDGFDSEKGILVLAATNRPEVLDKALLRPGRFDRRIIVEKPDLPGREAILSVHANKVKIAPDVDLHSVALATSGATGADLANMVNEAALLAVKEGRSLVAQKDLMEAVEVVIAGKEKKDRVMSDKERTMVAYHEVGHALVSALQKNSQPVQKITIVPRTMGSLGYTMNMPEEERYLMTRDEVMAEITTLLGGRAAEILQLGQVTTGASNDIERATKLARGMVTQYGMSKRFGPMGLASTQSQYLDGRNVSNCSQETETVVDDEVRKILDECQQKAIELLKENKNALSLIAEYLLERENITGEEFMNLLEKVNTTTNK